MSQTNPVDLKKYHHPEDDWFAYETGPIVDRLRDDWKTFVVYPCPGCTTPRCNTGRST